MKEESEPRLSQLIGPYVERGTDRKWTVTFLPPGVKDRLPGCQRQEYDSRLKHYSEWALDALGLKEDAERELNRKPVDRYRTQAFLNRVAAEMRKYDRTHAWSMGKLLELCMDT